MPSKPSVRMFQTPSRSAPSNVVMYQRTNLSPGAQTYSKPMTSKEAKANAARLEAANSKPVGGKKRSRANTIKNPRPADKAKRRELAAKVAARVRPQ